MARWLLAPVALSELALLSWRASARPFSRARARAPRADPALLLSTVWVRRRGRARSTLVIGPGLALFADRHRRQVTEPCVFVEGTMSFDGARLWHRPEASASRPLIRLPPSGAVAVGPSGAHSGLSRLYAGRSAPPLRRDARRACQSGGGTAATDACCARGPRPGEWPCARTHAAQTSGPKTTAPLSLRCTAPFSVRRIRNGGLSRFLFRLRSASIAPGPLSKAPSATTVYWGPPDGALALEPAPQSRAGVGSRSPQPPRRPTARRASRLGACQGARALGTMLPCSGAYSAAAGAPAWAQPELRRHGHILDDAGERHVAAPRAVARPCAWTPRHHPCRSPSAGWRRPRWGRHRQWRTAATAAGAASSAAFTSRTRTRCGRQPMARIVCVCLAMCAVRRAIGGAWSTF